MVTKAEVRTKFKDLLNNTLCTDALADHFIDLAVKRASRQLKIKDVEVISQTTIDGTYPGYISVPLGYKGIIEFRANDGTTEYRLTRKSSDESYAYAAFAGKPPKVYHREGDKFYIHPSPRDGDVITLHYWSALTVPATDGDEEDAYTEVYDLVIYGALIYAGDHFVDDRKASWQQTAQELLVEIDEAARIDDTGGQSIHVSSPYVGGY